MRRNISQKSKKLQSEAKSQKSNLVDMLTFKQVAFFPQLTPPSSAVALASA